MLSKEDKNKIISTFARSKNDTGSSEVQVALLSARIRQISDHLQKFPKDKHSRRGLIMLVGRRKSYFNYLKKVNPSAHDSCLNTLKEKGFI
ncbi:MAG: 30S ribosomal protein S15 [bacterium]